MTVEVEAFGRRVTDLYDIFNQLHIAEDIVEDTLRTLLLIGDDKLSECIVEQVGKIQQVFIRRHTYPNNILDMTCNMDSFSLSVQPLYAHIKLVLREGLHGKKAKEAPEKREKSRGPGNPNVWGFERGQSIGNPRAGECHLEGETQRFPTELGAAFLYFDGHRSGSAGRAAVGSIPQSPSYYPKNPFKVPREITEQVMRTLESETSIKFRGIVQTPHPQTQHTNKRKKEIKCTIGVPTWLAREIEENGIFNRTRMFYANTQVDTFARDLAFRLRQMVNENLTWA
ncbi:hypothetical protein P691DRAFT_789751 [Macrolepiota fuliginosa MF-IS2]|uniref:Uncharacterized protein n=1 Tax=Macrolepiota fuliginosa MF-IS2 TaxID=1400762 RepID=A0A9P5X3Q6_9AGAR|nr:hypothetical protein P691DRAFT_789751 [Macrolepiota fuliginosa MF-IS2]